MGKRPLLETMGMLTADFIFGTLLVIVSVSVFVGAMIAARGIGHVVSHLLGW